MLFILAFGLFGSCTVILADDELASVQRGSTMIEPTRSKAHPGAVGSLRRADVDVDPGQAPPGVVLVSIDGLASRYVDEYLAADILPTFAWLQEHAAYTHDARTEARISVTLPNHTSMITGRPAVEVPGADPRTHHGFLHNHDPGQGQTIHNAGNPQLDYAISIFDEIHDRGGYTSLYAGKSKFQFLYRSYVGEASRPDSIGDDDGRNKIDDFTINEVTSTLVDEFLSALSRGVSRHPNGPNFAMLHLRDTDSNGHTHGWGSEQYRSALQDLDAALGRILQTLRERTLLARTYLLVTTDHGGVASGHYDTSVLDVVQIPFYVWGPGIEGGADLYELSDGTRIDPGRSIPMDTMGSQPVRNGDAANLALALLGVDQIKGSLHRGMRLILQH
jgi:predicted AlkP superfamily pyrophosphatase or phosphodiesterase